MKIIKFLLVILLFSCGVCFADVIWDFEPPTYPPTGNFNGIDGWSAGGLWGK